jgi:hypothetical protein
MYSSTCRLKPVSQAKPAYPTLYPAGARHVSDLDRFEGCSLSQTGVSFHENCPLISEKPLVFRAHCRIISLIAKTYYAIRRNKVAAKPKAGAKPATKTTGAAKTGASASSGKSAGKGGKKK